MAEGWLPGEAMPMDSRASAMPLQDHSPTTDHHDAQAATKAQADAFSNLNFDRLPTVDENGYFYSSGSKFRSTTVTPPQTSTQLDCHSDRSIFAPCEECFYCPECSDNSDCESCFDQQSCADCVKACKECDNMDPSSPFPSATENACLDCGDWAAFFADTENSCLDFSAGQPLNPSDVANQEDAQEATFNQYIDFPEPNASEVQDSIAASAASFALLPIDEQQAINPGQVGVPDFLAGIGAQFDDVFTPYAANAFMSTSPTSGLDLLPRHGGGFDASAVVSLHQPSAPPARPASASEPGHPALPMPLKQQGAIHVIDVPATTMDQSSSTIYDNGTSTLLNQHEYIDLAMYPTSTSAGLLAPPGAFCNQIQPSPGVQMASSYAQPPNSSGVPFSGVPFSGPGLIMYPIPTIWAPSAQPSHPPAYHTPNTTNATLATPSCPAPPRSMEEDSLNDIGASCGRSVQTPAPVRRPPNRRAQRDKRFSCNYTQPSGENCPFSCPTRSQLKNHEDARHRGIKPYTCGVLVDADDKAHDEDGNQYQLGDPRVHPCTVAQVDASGISKHRRIHYGKKEKCFYCTKTFSKTDQRKRHCRRNVGGRAACPGLRDRPANRWVDAGISVYHQGKSDEERHQTQLPDDFETRVAQAHR